MTTQAVSGRRYFTKAWLLEQKSLIALLVLIAIVSTMSPNSFLKTFPFSTYCFPKSSSIF